MKKSFIIVSVVFTMLFLSITAFAGDIPESLLHSEDAQIFFGEVLSYHSNKEKPDIEVSPVKKIKGDVKEGTKQIYYNPWAMGNFKIKEGKIYLFTYYDDANTTDVFDVTTYDTSTLKLKHVEGDMWERFEKYLNDGEYGEARIEGMSPTILDDSYLFVGAVILVGIAGFLIGYKKRR